MYYHLFISHSWSYSDKYDRLVDMLDSANNFFYKNYSVPKDDPIHNTPDQQALYNAIKEQISKASCVLVLAGVYSTYSKWINIEIKIAKQEFYLSKPIIAIEYWGSERTSLVVKEQADTIVKWQTSSIIEAIRRYGKKSYTY